MEIQTFEKDDDGAWIKKVINNVQEMWNYINSVVEANIKRGHHPIEFDILWGYGHRVCPIPLIDPDIINLYEAVELAGAPAPRDVVHQPWIYIQARGIIRAEKARMEKLWAVTQSP